MCKLLIQFSRRRTEWLVQEDGMLWISMDGKAILLA